jgi:hypothetical protein
VPRVDAVGADAVSYEPGQQFMFLLNLSNEASRNTLSTAGAGSGLGPSDCSHVDVDARTSTKFEVPTLTRLAQTTQANLIHRGCLILRQDELCASLVRNLFSVVPVELESTNFAGGLVRWVR